MPTTVLSPATPLIGRDEALRALRHFTCEAMMDGGALRITGEAGTGKTALLEHAAETAAAAGGRVLRAVGVEFEADVAFAGLNQLLVPITDEIGGLGAEQRGALSAALGLQSASSVDQVAVADAAVAVLRQAATSRPLLLAVDDVPWLDRSSAFVLSFVARRLAASPIAFVAASRPSVDGFLDLVQLPELVLEPLDDERAEDLLRIRFPSLALPVVERLVAEARGNPLALLELPGTLTQAQRSACEPLPRVLPLTRRLHGLFSPRIRRLDDTARRLLTIAALDSTGDLAVLHAAGGCHSESLSGAVHAGLITLDQERQHLSFRHPLVRSTAVELASHVERRCAHEALARALTESPERRAWHLAEAAIGPDEHVAELLEAAAEVHLRRGDAVGAVSALLRAGDMSPTSPARSRRLAQAAYVGANVAGALQNVSRLLVDARHADPDLGGSLQAAVATAYLLLNSEGDVDTAHRVLSGAIAATAGPGDVQAPAFAEALHTLMMVCWFGGDRPELWRALEEGIARLEPDPAALLSLCSRSFCDPARTTDEDLEALERLIARLHAEDDPVRIVRTGMAALFVDRVPDCRAAHWRVVRNGRRGGAVTPAIDALIHLCLDDVLAGRWDDALRLADEGSELCTQHGYRILEWPLLFGRGVVAACRGDETTASELSEAMAGWAAPRRAQAIAMCARYVRALTSLGRCDFEDAYRHAAVISPPGVLAAHVPLSVWAMPLLVEAAVRSGRHDHARAHVDVMERLGVSRISPRLSLAVEGSRAMVASADAAAGIYADALAIPGIERWPFDLGRVHLDFGAHLRRTGQMQASRAHLATAAEVFEALRAEPWARRTRNELRATGQARSRPGPPDMPRLTPQETQIAQMAAAGLSNKQIAERLYLSPRTIGGHLYRIFPKLDITSRAALRDALQFDSDVVDRVI